MNFDSISINLRMDRKPRLVSQSCGEARTNSAVPLHWGALGIAVIVDFDHSIVVHACDSLITQVAFVLGFSNSQFTNFFAVIGDAGSRQR